MRYQPRVARPKYPTETTKMPEYKIKPSEGWGDEDHIYEFMGVTMPSKLTEHRGRFKKMPKNRLLVLKPKQSAEAPSTSVPVTLADLVKQLGKDTPIEFAVKKWEVLKKIAEPDLSWQDATEEEKADYAKAEAAIQVWCHATRKRKLKASISHFKARVASCAKDADLYLKFVSDFQKKLDKVQEEFNRDFVEPKEAW